MGQLLGKLEFPVLMTVAKQIDKAYGVSIRRTLLEDHEQDVSIGALYTTLDRLTRKGLISSRVGEATPVRGGRAKKYFKIEAAGEQALTQHLDALNKMQTGWSLGLSMVGGII